MCHSHFLISGPGHVSVTPTAKSWVGFVFTFRRRRFSPHTADDSDTEDCSSLPVPGEFVCVRVWSLQPESLILQTHYLFVVTQLMISSKSITALCLVSLSYSRGANKLLLPQTFKSTYSKYKKAKINASCPQTGNIYYLFSSPCPMVSRLGK